MDILKVLGVLLSDIEKNTESDVEQKVIVPWLKRLGYTPENGARLVFRKSKAVPVGSRFETIIPDIAIYMNEEPFMILDSKPINRTIQQGDVNEAVSNGRLYEFPKQFPLSVVSTGLRWEVYSTSDREYLGDERAIPDVKEARRIVKEGLPEVTDSERKEAERFIRTRILIKDEGKARALFAETKTRIEAEGKRGLVALGEMSRLILAKIYEEQHSVQEDRPSRFSTEFLERQLQDRPMVTATDVINEIFDQANESYRGGEEEGIFPEGIGITLKPGTVKLLVKLLEPYEFYGAGEDIKGAIYETFLRETFRGDFSQYFTPREVVQFMVDLLGMKPGERIIDPACGSGGFLIHSFLEVKKRILEMDVSDEEKRRRLDKLLNEDLWGIDTDETLVQFCRINLLIHGDGYKNIHREDALDKKASILEPESVDVVITNPPFDLPSEHLEHLIGDYELYKKHNYGGADVLYLEPCYELLKSGGRMAMVVPHRFIDGTRFEALREWILERFVLRAVVVLPVGVFKPFGGSNARTSVLYLRKPKTDKERRGRALMATVRYVGFRTGVQEYKPIPYNDLENIASSQQLIDLKAEEESAHGIR
jgi:type I restriction enzyme M protein